MSPVCLAVSTCPGDGRLVNISTQQANYKYPALNNTLTLQNVQNRYNIKMSKYKCIPLALALQQYIVVYPPSKLNVTFIAAQHYCGGVLK